MFTICFHVSGSEQSPCNDGSISVRRYWNAIKYIRLCLKCNYLFKVLFKNIPPDCSRYSISHVPCLHGNHISVSTGHDSLSQQRILWNASTRRDLLKRNLLSTGIQYMYHHLPDEAYMDQIHDSVCLGQVLPENIICVYWAPTTLVNASAIFFKYWNNVKVNLLTKIL